MDQIILDFGNSRAIKCFFKTRK